MFSAEKIREILESELPDCTARVVDTAGDGEHFAAEVISSADAPCRRGGCCGGHTLCCP